ncbi:MAG: hypothetical protein H0T62_14025 [Parachlamydiaceae bacterium]|nr:hypothetical protein [Parachlamydiaceae bacterium]
MKIRFTHFALAFLLNLSFVGNAYSNPLAEIHSCMDDAEEVLELDYTGIYDAYRYVSVGVGPLIFTPNIGIGYRVRNSQYGWDTSLSFSTIGYAHQLSGHVVGHYYLDPHLDNSTYVGFGLLASGVLSNHHHSASTLSPDFVVGKGLESTGNRKHFIEAHVAAPTLWKGSKHFRTMHFPLMYVKYGFSY